MATGQLLLCIAVLLGVVCAREIGSRSARDILSDIQANYIADGQNVEEVQVSPLREQRDVSPSQEDDEAQVQEAVRRHTRVKRQADPNAVYVTKNNLEPKGDGYDYYALAKTGHASTVKNKLTTIRKDINDYAADYYRIMLERFDRNVSFYNNKMMPFKHDKTGSKIPSGEEVKYEEIDVKIKFSPYSLVELDEKGMTMQLVGEFWLIWSEKMLQFQDEAAVWTITVTKDMVWTPPILVDNGVDGVEGIGSADDTISLTRIGYLQWRTKTMLKTSCDIIVTNFPFDSQRCDIVIVSPPDMSMEFILWGEEGKGYAVEMDKYNQDGSWELVDHNSFLYNLISDTKNLQLTYSFIFRRRPMFYIFSTLLPVLLLSLTASLVFVLPVDAGEKMGTGITIVLAYAVYLTIVSEYLPDSSVDVCIVSVYLILLLSFSAFGVVCSAFLLRVYHKPESEPVPLRVRSMTRFLQRMMFMTLRFHINPEPEDEPKKPLKRMSDGHTNSGFSDLNEKGGIYDNHAMHEEEESTADGDEIEKHDMDWNDVAKTLDWFFYIVFSILTLLSTVVCFSVTYFDLLDKTPTLDDLGLDDTCDAIEYNIKKSGRTQWQNYDKTPYPKPLCDRNNTSY